MELLEKIKERLDPDELVEILGLSTEELVLLLMDVILTKLPSFDYLNDEEDYDI